MEKSKPILCFGKVEKEAAVHKFVTVMSTSWKTVPDKGRDFRHAAVLPVLCKGGNRYTNPSLFEIDGLVMMLWILDTEKHLMELKVVNPLDQTEAFCHRGTYTHITEEWLDLLQVFGKLKTEGWTVHLQFANALKAKETNEDVEAEEPEKEPEKEPQTALTPTSPPDSSGAPLTVTHQQRERGTGTDKPSKSKSQSDTGDTKKKDQDEDEEHDDEEENKVTFFDIIKKVLEGDSEDETKGKEKSKAKTYEPNRNLLRLKITCSVMRTTIRKYIRFEKLDELHSILAASEITKEQSHRNQKGLLEELKELKKEVQKLKTQVGVSSSGGSTGSESAGMTIKVKAKGKKGKGISASKLFEALSRP